MDVIVERCAGLDVHRDSVVATVRLPGTGKSRRRREQQTRSFGTTIGQLETLADWLQGFGVTLVGMEATGVYWKPVFSVLEGRFECWLLNAQHLHNVPGRKERRDRLGLVLPAARARARAAQLRVLEHLLQPLDRPRALFHLGDAEPGQVAQPADLRRR